MGWSLKVLYDNYIVCAEKPTRWSVKYR